MEAKLVFERNYFIFLRLFSLQKMSDGLASRRVVPLQILLMIIRICIPMLLIARNTSNIQVVPTPAIAVEVVGGGTKCYLESI